MGGMKPAVSGNAFRRLLFRDYIHQSLYDLKSGYFCSSTPPVLRHESRPKFSSIATRNDYQAIVAATYANAPHGWMTPVELFSPYLSRAIANRVRGVASKKDKLNIIEIGAGHGTLAADILEHWRHACPDDLRNTCYHVVEISPELAAVQRRNLKAWVDSGHAYVHNADATIWFEDLRKNRVLQAQLLDGSCHVIGTEVLDNLAHDLVRFTPEGLEQAEVIIEVDGSDRKSKAVSVAWSAQIDETTAAAMRAFDIQSGDSHAGEENSLGDTKSPFFQYLKTVVERMLGGGSQELWVPSSSFRLLHSVTASLPHAHLTLSDFDCFPGALSGVNGPVVQSVERGSTVVYDSVQAAPFGEVDIMFPTDFVALKKGHENLTNGSQSHHSHVRRVISQQQFFDEYAAEEDKEESTCGDNYNPILQDFENASFLLTDANLLLPN